MLSLNELLLIQIRFIVSGFGNLKLNFGRVLRYVEIYYLFELFLQNVSEMAQIFDSISES